MIVTAIQIAGTMQNLAGDDTKVYKVQETDFKIVGKNRQRQGARSRKKRSVQSVREHFSATSNAVFVDSRRRLVAKFFEQIISLLISFVRGIFRLILHARLAVVFFLLSFFLFSFLLKSFY